MSELQSKATAEASVVWTYIKSHFHSWVGGMVIGAIAMFIIVKIL